MKSSRLIKLNHLLPNFKVANNPDRQLIATLEDQLVTVGLTLPELISRRSLYFRISVVGNCNLSCMFCHNEGGPPNGSIDPILLKQSLSAAHSVGFRRVQFTGGEPLINPNIFDYVRHCAHDFGDVGITTNGVLLSKKLNTLLGAGITRIHISLQKETLAREGENAPWMVPPWLNEIVSRCETTGVKVRFNLPIAEKDFLRAREFLVDTRLASFSLKVFALLSNSTEKPACPDYIERLRLIVTDEARDRIKLGVVGKVQLRTYLEPNGLRCGSCGARNQCTEASRSLRLGSDGIFRPCLASRESDFKTNPNSVFKDIRSATLLALDYLPFNEEHHEI